MIAAGDRLDYHTDSNLPAVGILHTKIHLINIISGAKEDPMYCVSDIMFCI